MSALRNTITITFMLGACAVGIESCSPKSYASDAPRWELKTGLVLVDTDEPFAVDKPSGGRVEAGGNAALGWAIGLEYRATNLIGYEVGLAYAKTPDVDDTADTNRNELGEGPSFMPLMAGVNFHFLDSDQFDVYAGPRIAYVRFGDVDLDVDGQSTAFDIDSELAWGASGGFTYRFGESRWAVTAQATYLDLDMEITQRDTAEDVTIGVNPLMLTLGASFRF